MNQPTIAVTGATGHIGGLVAAHLDTAGRAQRLLVRDPASPRLPQLGSVTEVARIDYANQDLSQAALQGVEVLFMVSAHESPTRTAEHAAFIDAAAAAGVRHVVYTSFAAAAPDATFTLARDHYATEEHLLASGMAWTFLRDTFYIDFMEQLVGTDGVIRGPAGSGRCAIVARADVARVAATVLLDPDAHAGNTYDLTGPQALSLRRCRPHHQRRPRPHRHVPRRDDRGGLRLPRLLRRPAVAARRLGQHLHRHRQQRHGRPDRRRREDHRHPADQPRGVPPGPRIERVSRCTTG